MHRALLSIGFLIAAFPVIAADAVPPLPALAVRGEDFVDASGKPVRFWGVNLVACYPDHDKADQLAANLESVQVNLVRPHHLLRPSSDWNPRMVSGCLVAFRNNSRAFDSTALDRFDYLNAALRRHGIYLAFSAHFSRQYLTGDVDILKTDDEKDRSAWMAAMRELNGWTWQKAIDVRKMLPVIDERAALLNEEFVKKLLTHVNPYTGTAYAVDSQVLTFEVLNEFSSEYTIVCGNRFPNYWNAKLVEKWNAFATAAGIVPGDIYRPADAKAKEVRSQFLRKLDEDYFTRMKAVIRGTGCKASITFSNLWRGETAAELHAQLADHIENHLYMDPLVVTAARDGIADLTQNAIAGKPFFVGEINQAEGAQNILKQSATRAMLPLAASAYGSLQNWSGIVWFAWLHGDSLLGNSGWATVEGRASNLGGMINDGMMIDHLRTTGMIFRRGLVAKSKSPVTINVDAPFNTSNYNALMAGKYPYMPGWQDIHEIRKSFDFGSSSGEKKNEWFTDTVSNPIVSDTGEIVKDVERKQLTVAAPEVEAFAGYIDSNALAGLKHLIVDGEKNIFGVVELVSSDGRDLEQSTHLIISRTGLNAANLEVAGPLVRLRGLKKPEKDQHWYLSLTRPREAAALLKEFIGNSQKPLDPMVDGALELPLANWNECELTLR